MQNVVSFWSDFFQLVASFLMSEPIVYFVSIIILIMLVGVLQRFLFIKE